MTREPSEAALEAVRKVFKEAGLTILPDMQAPCDVLIEEDGSEKAIIARSIKCQKNELTREGIAGFFAERKATRIALYQVIDMEESEPPSQTIDPITFELSPISDKEAAMWLEDMKSYLIRFYFD